MSVNTSLERSTYEWNRVYCSRHGNIAKDFFQRETRLRWGDNAKVVWLDIGIGSVEDQAQIVFVRSLNKIVFSRVFGGILLNQADRYYKKKKNVKAEFNVRYFVYFIF